MATMYEVLNKFLQDPERKENFTSLAQDSAYRDLYLAVSRDAPHAIVDPSPADVKRLASAAARSGSVPADEVKATQSMITQMYRKSDVMAELKERNESKKEPEGPSRPGPSR